MKSKQKNIRGSILMETVLVIPLYLVFLSGVFWLGDLALLRSKSIFFDRFSAWGSGHRHRPLFAVESGKFLSRTFLNPEKVGRQHVDSVRIAPPDHSSSVWLFIAGATTVVSLEPPVWTTVWRNTALTMMEQHGSGFRRTSFRSREIKAGFMHRNLMRVKNDFREKTKVQSLAEKMDWLRKVYYASWPVEWTGGETPPVQGVFPCKKYERHQAFVQWSE